MNDSREFQDVESIFSGKLSHVPSQPAIVPSLCGMLSRDRSLRPATWKLLGTSGNVFGTPRPVIDSSSTPYQGLLHSSNRSATGGNPVRESTGKPVARIEERTRERRFQRRDLQRDHQPSILSFQQKVRTHRIYVADQQRVQISELQFGLQRFHVGRQDSKPK